MSSRPIGLMEDHTKEQRHVFGGKMSAFKILNWGFQGV